MRFSRRGWNNVLMIGIIMFMIILNLPTIIKNNFLEPEQDGYPYLLNPDYQVQQMNFAHWSLHRENDGWKATIPLSMEPLELVQRWQSLIGTEVNEETYHQLKTKLLTANTIEVWFFDKEEPQRITYYEMPQFWLMKNWQQKWIAVSVDQAYLFPESVPK